MATNKHSSGRVFNSGRMHAMVGGSLTFVPRFQIAAFEVGFRFFFWAGAGRQRCLLALESNISFSRWVSTDLNQSSNIFGQCLRTMTNIILALFQIRCIALPCSGGKITIACSQQKLSLPKSGSIASFDARYFLQGIITLQTSKTYCFPNQPK